MTGSDVAPGRVRRDRRPRLDPVSGSSPMARALQLAAQVRTATAPNPWVGCVLVSRSGEVFEGATEPPGGPHAEVVAIGRAGEEARGSVLYTTLEPCAHQGRTPPCTGAIVAAGVSKVVVGILDPDPQVCGRGVEELRDRGVEVEVGEMAEEVSAQLAPYLKHRRTGRPWVILKLGASADGRIAAPDGSSRWITGEAARRDAHRLRAESDAVLVGAGTVRVDDPSLTARDGSQVVAEPLRVVLGSVPRGAKVRPALEMRGDPGGVLDDLGARGVLQVLVEGGSQVAHRFHEAGVVDRYVLYLAPALFGGDDAVPMFRGAGAPDMARIWRGRFVSMEPLGSDLRLELEAVGAEVPAGLDALIGSSSNMPAGEDARTQPDQEEV